VIKVENEQDIEQTMTDNPREPVCWERPDGYIEIHPPFGAPVRVVPGRQLARDLNLPEGMVR